MHSVAGGVLGTRDMVGPAREATGYGYMRVKREDLQNALVDAAEKAGITVRYGKKLVSVEETEDGVEVAFADGTADEGDVLLGCDGIHSAVRRLYVDPNTSPEYTGMAGLGALTPGSAVPAHIHPHIQGFHITLTQDGMFMMSSCTAADDEFFWGLQHEMPAPEGDDTRDGWEVRTKAEMAGFKTKVAGVLDSVGGEWGAALREVVENTSEAGFYPVYSLPPGGKWHRGRALLLGDAAHAMPPSAGQGASMAFEDAFLLARLFEKRSCAVEDVYAEFIRLRRPRVEDISGRAMDNGKIRRKTEPWGLWFKELGLWLFMQGSYALGMDRWGSTVQHMTYDVEEEVV